MTCHNVDKGPHVSCICVHLRNSSGVDNRADDGSTGHGPWVNGSRVIGHGSTGHGSWVSGSRVIGHESDGHPGLRTVDPTARNVCKHIFLFSSANQTVSNATAAAHAGTRESRG